MVILGLNDLGGACEVATAVGSEIPRDEEFAQVLTQCGPAANTAQPFYGPGRALSMA